MLLPDNEEFLYEKMNGSLEPATHCIVVISNAPSESIMLSIANFFLLPHTFYPLNDMMYGFYECCVVISSYLLYLLQWEQLKEFHSMHYHPSNSRYVYAVFLKIYGGFEPSWGVWGRAYRVFCDGICKMHVAAFAMRLHVFQFVCTHVHKLI